MRLRARFRAIRAYSLTEARHLARDRTTLTLVFLVPILQIILFGYAVRLEPRETPVAIAGAPGQAQARRTLDEAGGFHVIAAGRPSGEAARLVRLGKARIGVELPSSPASPSIRVIIDDADVGPARAAAARLEKAYWRDAARNAARPPTPLGVVWLYNARGRTDWSIAPGLIGVIVMISMLLLGALSLVKERERGSWESVALAPAASDVVLGKLAPYVVIGAGQAMLALAAAVALFDLPVRGDVAALLGLAVFNAAFHLCLGFALSALAASQLQAIQAAVFFYLPNMLLSGFMFPFEAMPPWARAMGEALPLTHVVRAARGVCLQGWAAARLAPEIGFLALATLAAGALAWGAFRWGSRAAGA